jgi:hypothetical protein
MIEYQDVMKRQEATIENLQAEIGMMRRAAEDGWFAMKENAKNK